MRSVVVERTDPTETNVASLKDQAETSRHLVIRRGQMDPRISRRHRGSLLHRISQTIAAVQNLTSPKALEGIQAIDWVVLGLRCDDDRSMRNRCVFRWIEAF